MPSPGILMRTTDEHGGVSGMAEEPDITFEPATCMHCEGLGCIYCNRTGTVLVRAPKTICPECEGAGCIYCGFTGWARPKTKCD